MREVRGHTMRDIVAIVELIDRERRERERAERRRKAHAASRKMSGGR